MRNRILSLLVLLALLLSLLVSCSKRGATPVGSTAPSGAETIGEETEPRDPLDVGDVFARLTEKRVVIGRPDLVFDLTQSEIDRLFARIEEIDALIEAGTDYPAFNALYDEVYGTGFDRIKTQAEIIYILWSCDLSDRLTEAATLYVEEVSSEIEKRYFETFRAVFDSPFRDEFYADWTPEEIAFILEQAAGYTDEMIRLSSENDDLLVAFRALSDENEDFGAESARLFLEMANNNDRIAELLGYDSFMDYAYPEIYGRDFSPAEAAGFHELFRDDLMPVLASLSDLLNDGKLTFESLGVSDYLHFYRFIAGEVRDAYFTDLIDRYSAAVGEIAPTYSETYRDFWSRKNYYFVPESVDALEGAFTTYLSENGTPMIYFGPEYHSPYTFVHEFGHYYVAAGSENGASGISFDLAETQSQGNEFLFTYWLNEGAGFSKKIAKSLAEYKMYETLNSILSASLVNDFECYVYTHLDELTPEMLDGVLISLCDGYGGYDAVKAALGYAPEIYWHYVVMESPGYYISYALSAVPALELYAKALNDGFDAAVAAYETVAKADIEAGFLAALAAAGLGSPFDGDALSALAATLAPNRETEE